MATKRTVFNYDWVNPEINPDWANIIQPVKKNKFQAFCKTCKKVIELSNMGRQAIISHLKSVGHKTKNVQFSKDQPTILDLHGNWRKLSINTTDAAKTVTIQPVIHTENASSSSITQQNVFSLKEETVDAEIVWALNVVMTHKSWRSVTHDISCMKRMFKDSIICKQLNLSPAKIAYVVCHGLAPFFNNQLQNYFVSCDKLVVCFDESLNKIVQKGQMDILIRFWNTDQNEVQTRYLTSVFLHHAAAEDLLTKFKEGIQFINPNKIIQVSMDGPNVNWKFFALLQEDEETSKILDIGSCGPHVLHGAIGTGQSAAGWDIGSFLRGIYYLFTDSPARRGDYTAITNCKVFPLKFCKVRWVENVKVTDRALELFSPIKEYVDNVNKFPNSQSAKTVKNAYKDSTLKLKLAFFSYISGIFEPFLTKFQTAKPMVPFLYEDLDQLVRSLLSKFIKKEFMEITTRKLIKLDLNNSNLYIDLSKIDVGYGVKKYMKTLKITEKEKLLFLRDCRIFFIATIKKVCERSNLKYNLVKYMSGLSPKLIARDKESAETRMNNLLQVLHDNNLITTKQAEGAKIQFSTRLLAEPSFIEGCKNFNDETDRIDTLFIKHIESNLHQYQELFQVLKTVLILSHGNATVESGFSINKEILIENLKEHSLISQRQVYDAIHAIGGIQNFNICSGVRSSFKSSHHNYKAYMEQQKKEQAEVSKTIRAKKILHSEIYHLEAKKKKLEEDSKYALKVFDAEINELRKKM